MVKNYKIALLTFVLFFLTPFLTKAATLSITPSNATFEVGDTITLQIKVSSDEPINAISGSILLPQSIFSIESVSKVSSILNFWVAEPSFSNVTHIVNFEGVALSGFSGSSGNVLTIRLKALKDGIGKIDFQSGQVLANDGKGTDLTSGLIGSLISVNPKTVITPEKTKQEEIIPVVDEEKEETHLVQILKSPEISLGYRYGEPSILGISDYPKEKILINFISEEGVKVFITTESVENGSFAMTIPSSLRKGIYTAKAFVVKENGDSSISSNEIKVRVGSLFSDLSFESISLLMLLILIIAYQYWKILHSSPKRVSRKVINEVHDAVNKTHKSFDILRDDIKNKRTTILKKDIDEAEKMISREIEDIENI